MSYIAHFLPCVAFFAALRTILPAVRSVPELLQGCSLPRAAGTGAEECQGWSACRRTSSHLLRQTLF
jgi:hypothetical protein